MSSEPAAASRDDHRVVCHLAALLEQRGMTLTELSARADITMANLSILKTNKARAIRFTTLTTICDILECTPGDLLTIGGEAEAQPSQP